MANTILASYFVLSGDQGTKRVILMAVLNSHFTTILLLRTVVLARNEHEV